ncbi:MSMEG_0569 family flavin-dependent oxidoreductase [Streptosporangium sp. NPDC049046]|uniref:MSMEG_0569 family flavin-dependent oxidoreductase n=1 Tax=unclassified Streptosporangium TaxID=2632669 RepID=UPI0034142FA0
MNGRHHEVVVVGAGQAGLSMSHCLRRDGVDHLVLERHRVGHEWRARRWDSFCLVTPNWQCRLPGFPYPGDDHDGFMLRDQIVGYLEDYAASFSPPVLEGVNVTRLLPDGRGFRVETDRGTVTAGQVVVATGPYQVPVIPRVAERFPAHVTQIHSADYRNPELLPPGEVLVVGTGQSGCQIAEDLHLAGRRVHLSVGGAPRVARFYRGRDVVAWLDLMGYYDRPIDSFDDHDAVRARANHYVTGRDGGRDIDLRAFALEGMSLYGRLTTVENDTATGAGTAEAAEERTGGRARFAPDLRRNLDHADAVCESVKDSIDAFIAAHGISAPGERRYTPPWQPASEPDSLDLGRITSVVWCTGFRRDHGWIRVPVFDGTGYPTHERGVTRVPGLYFLGLPWQHTWGSGRFSGVAADAEHLAGHIAAAGRPVPAPRAAEPASLGYFVHPELLGT